MNKKERQVILSALTRAKKNLSESLNIGSVATPQSIVRAVALSSLVINLNMKGDDVDLLLSESLSIIMKAKSLK